MDPDFQQRAATPILTFPTDQAHSEDLLNMIIDDEI